MLTPLTIRAFAQSDTQGITLPAKGRVFLLAYFRWLLPSVGLLS
jgi:hypothetical protein